MPAAARVTDTTSHGSPLSAGPGSSNVFIGQLPAWRALPAGVGAGLEAASSAMSTLMSAPTLTPVDATASLAQIQTGLTQAAGAVARAGNPAAVTTTATAMATLNATNTTLTSAYIAAAAVPGGAAAAAVAYTRGIQAAAASAAGTAVSAIGALADVHVCPLPCGAAVHGPGVVTRGSGSVFINQLPASRQGDSVYEACGGADAIAAGSPNVFIGDAGGSAAGAGSAGAALASLTEQMETAVADALAELALVQAAATVGVQNRAAAASGKGLCEICETQPGAAQARSSNASPADSESSVTETPGGSEDSTSSENEPVADSAFILELAAQPATATPFAAYPLREDNRIGYRITFADGEQQSGSFAYRRQASVHQIGLTAWQGEHIDQIELWGEPYAHTALVDTSSDDPLAQGRVSTHVHTVYGTPTGWLGTCRVDVLQGVAAFTAEQMTRNLSDPDVLECARLNRVEADSAEAQYRYGHMMHKDEGWLGFAQSVFFAGGGEGDFKPIIRPVWGTDNRLGDDPRVYYYDLWANLHFGYVGRAAGFSLELLLDRANAFNRIDSGKPDPATDELAIRTGYWLHQRYASGITVEQLAAAIAEHHVYRRD